MPNFSDIVDAYKKLPTSLFLTVWIILALILLSPEEFTKALGIKEFRDTYKVFIGPVWLLVLAMLISRGLVFLQEKRDSKKRQKVRESKLKGLTNEEKSCLLEFIEADKPAIYRSINDGAICALNAKKIVYRPNSIADHWDVFAYCIQPWAKEYLEKHPELLD
ncbi:super-infection exclusion protein B [Klebsiella michiganensis]|uniref:super-infection exclusion protein B n=1 Tax=Klebsiella michiganensis TaxID=1134687 RepID=UPI001CCAEB2F|nr:super-infection exclusion protein B [Klebsiella michiganensis]